MDRPRAKQKEELGAQREELEARLQKEALEDAQDAAAAGKEPPTGNPLDVLKPEGSGEAMTKVRRRDALRCPAHP